jgi:proteasome activator subunit 4
LFSGIYTTKEGAFASSSRLCPSIVNVMDFINSYSSVHAEDPKSFSASYDASAEMKDSEIILSIPETPVESADSEMSAMEKQRASLQTYLDSLPYECESVDEMQAVLENIVGKIVICAQTKNWLKLAIWDEMLQW